MTDIVTQQNSIFNKLKLQTAISAIIAFCKQFDYSVAIWRKPISNEVVIMLDYSSGQLTDELILEKMAPGFIFAPFDKEKSKIVLKCDLLITFGEALTITSQQNDKFEILEAFCSAYSDEHEIKFSASKPDDKDAANYQELVRECIAGIKNGHFSKIVPSRQLTIPYKGHYPVGIHYLRLAEAYPNAFVSLTFSSLSGLWMGATPELLLSTENTTFKTVALAGTQAYDASKSLGEVAWTQKEIEEQALVSRYIINCFKKIRLREFAENGPKTIKAGNLIHLKTTFEVNMADTNFPELGSTMLKLLHPTSAICGMPLEPSLAYLKANEHYDRKFYSGYLGPVNIKGQTSMFVNLRCMHIDKRQLTLFAGAGVTEDSIPEKEWKETQMKMNTLLAVIDTN